MALVRCCCCVEQVMACVNGRAHARGRVDQVGRLPVSLWNGCHEALEGCLLLHACMGRS